MTEPKILVLGKFSPADIIVSVSESNRKIDPVIESKIEAVWTEKKKEAEKAGKVCYNSTSYRVNSLKKLENKIEIDFGMIEYKILSSLTNISGYLDLPEEFYKNGCFCGATVKTSDGLYVMVEPSGKSMNYLEIDLLGGMIEKPLEIKDGKDVFQALLDELKEEACIDKVDIIEMYLRSIYITIKTDVGFYFEVTLNISSTELVTRFEKENKDQDIKGLKILNREEYIKVLGNHNPSKRMIAKIVQI